MKLHLSFKEGMAVYRVLQDEIRQIESRLKYLEEKDSKPDYMEEDRKTQDMLEGIVRVMENM